MVKSKDTEIEYTLKSYFKIKGDYTISDHGAVTVEGNCSLIKNCETLPITFDYIAGTFHIPDRGLTSLKGCPIRIGGAFFCSRNPLSSLEGGPQRVDSYMEADYLPLTSLLGAPKHVRDMSCCYGTLSSLDGFPENLLEGFIVSWNEHLPLLRLLKCKSEIIGNDQVFEIIERWVEGEGSLRSRIIGCQNELIAKGFEGNAKW